MRRAALSAVIGLAAALLLAGGYFGAARVGLHASSADLLAVAASVLFGSLIAVFSQLAIGPTPPKPKGAELLTSKLRELDSAFVTAFPMEGGGTVRLMIRPDTRVDTLDVVKNPSGYANSKILVTFRKVADRSAMFGPTPNGFNPIPIKQLFMALKDKPNFLHVLLLDDHDEYLGYLPAFFARSQLAEENAEPAIRKYIIDVLSGAAPSSVLREIGGFGAEDWVSNDDKVSLAMNRMSERLLRGLVVLQGSRHRKPIAIVYADDLIRATTPR